MFVSHLKPGGVDAGDRVELRDAALSRRVKALGLSAHLEEHFLFLLLPCKLFLQSLQGGDKNTSVSYGSSAKCVFLSVQYQHDDGTTKLSLSLQIL